MSQFIVGIDPGASGAIAIINGESSIVIVDDLPTMKPGKRTVINGAALASILRPYLADIRIAVVEQVATRPGQGIASSGALMHSLGVIDGVIAALGIPSRHVPPTVWKKAAGLGADKEQARARAIALWPDAPLSRKKDHGRAEALLLAKHGRGLTN